MALNYIVFVVTHNTTVKPNDQPKQLIFSFFFWLNLASTFSHEAYKAAKKELLNDANAAYHTIIGRATCYEIVATILVLIGTAISYKLAVATKKDDV